MDAQPPPRHNDLAGPMDPGSRIHTAPSKCVVCIRGDSSRPALLTTLRNLPEEGGGEARLERKSYPPPAFPESRPLEETPISFPSMSLCV